MPLFCGERRAIGSIWRALACAVDPCSRASDELPTPCWASGLFAIDPVVGERWASPPTPSLLGERQTIDPKRASDGFGVSLAQATSAPPTPSGRARDLLVKAFWHHCCVNFDGC